MLERLEAKAASILADRRLDRMTRRYGGTQKCTWCRQCAQDGDGWSFKPFPDDFSLDVLTCGVCGGTSLWRWGMGMHFVSPLDPPTPAFQAVEVVPARSRDSVEARQQAQAALDKVMNSRFSNFDAGAVIHWAERGMYEVKASPRLNVGFRSPDLDEVSMRIVKAIFHMMVVHNLRLSYGSNRDLPDALTEEQETKEKAHWQIIVRELLSSVMPEVP